MFVEEDRFTRPAANIGDWYWMALGKHLSHCFLLNINRLKQLSVSFQKIIVFHAVSGHDMKPRKSNCDIWRSADIASPNWSRLVMQYLVG